MNIVLVEPEIPGNTGTIARTCAATGTQLHLVRPLGFSVEDKYLKRAGLDYWHLIDVQYYDSFEEVLKKYPEGQFRFFSTKARQDYSQAQYGIDDFLVFGKETKGLPMTLLTKNADRSYRVPMIDIPEARSLNLSNSVSIVLYEALRQHGFRGLR